MNELDLTCVPEKITMAKSSKEADNKWLPCYMHAIDTAITIEYLLSRWVSRAEKNVLCEAYKAVNGKPTEYLITKEEMHKIGRFLALLHDLGKVTEEFQSKIAYNLPEIRDRLEDNGLQCRRQKDNSVRHALLSQLLLLRDRNRKNEKNLVAAACILGAHHGKPSENSNEDDWLKNCVGKWQEYQEDWVKYALKQSGYNDLSEIPQIKMSAQVLWSGLLIMADWIASNTRYFEFINLDDSGENTNYAKRKEKAFNRLNLTICWVPDEGWLYQSLIESRFHFKPNEIQELTETAVKETKNPGIFVLEAPMGSGKTEAALAAAEIIASKTGHSGVFFGLPTQATANGIFKRIENWVKTQSANESHSIRLVHGAAHLNADYQSLCEGTAYTGEDEKDASSSVVVNQWFSGRKCALLADFVVGTVDQLLMAGLRQKHVMLRHLGLANKIVIVDEVHAYDAYMNIYLKRTLAWLGAYHVPVILLSATLPASKRAELIEAYINQKSEAQNWQTALDYPVLTYSDSKEIKQKSILRQEQNNNISLSFAPYENDNFSKLVLELKNLLGNGGIAGVVVNTVKRAQTAAKLLREHFDKNEVCLIHSQFLMPHRAEREAMLLKALGKQSREGLNRPFRLVVIGTQILEQSLDIDFDYLVSDLCPIDLLLQRIGRLHRHPNRERPPLLQNAQCKILCAHDNELEGGASAIYGEYLLMRTKNILKENSHLSLPACISPLVQKVYSDSEEGFEQIAETKEYIAAKKTHNLNMEDKKNKAKDFQIVKPNSSIRRPYIYGFLDMNREDKSRTDPMGCAAVRDGDPSIEVIALKYDGESNMYFLSDDELKNPISASNTPSEEEAKKIAEQRLRLPHQFSVFYKVDETINELENCSSKMLKEWLYSVWLNGELFLIFDKNGRASLNGKALRYSNDYGLEIEQ